MQVAKESGHRVEGASKRKENYWEHSRFTVFRLLILLVIRRLGQTTTTQIADGLAKHLHFSPKEILSRGNICNIVKSFLQEELVEIQSSPDPFRTYVLTKKGRDLIDMMLTVIEAVEIEGLDELED